MIQVDPRITKLYKDVPKLALERLQTFRNKFPYQSMTIGGRNWKFIDSKVGDSALLLFAGGTTVAEVSINSIEHLAKKHRVIAPDYPPIDNLQEFIEGCVELLDRLGVEQFSAMGGSYGGWMLQSFVRSYPERINNCVISVVGPPNPENSRQLAKMMPLIRFIPMFMLRSLVNRTFTSLESDRTSTADQLMLWALVKEAVFHRIGREDFLALSKRLVDQTLNYTFSPDDLVDFPGEILMLFGSDDPATPPEKRDAMKALYPQAKIVVIEGGEHSISLSHKDQYYSAIDAFLTS